MGAVANVLLVDNNPADVRLIREALGDSKLRINVDVIGDAEAALEYLARSISSREIKRPDLILLDLVLPGMSGKELLRTLKSDAVLKVIPVIVFTSFRSWADIQDTYDRHGNCFIAKPADLSDFVTTIRAIEEFWLEHVSLPNRESTLAAFG